MPEATITADVRITVTARLLEQLLQLPDGWRLVELGTVPDATYGTILVADVVLPDGPLGSQAPIELMPCYRYLHDVAGAKGITLVRLAIPGVDDPTAGA